MNATRRCFLKFCGGAAAGALVSPLPWKLLDDVSIWTQNWSWTARPPRGPVGAAYTTCTLCPTGCGLRLRTIGEHVVSAWGVAGHPQGAGALCPLGTGFAQLKHHPLRLASAVRRDGEGAWVAADADALTAEVGRRVRESLEANEGHRIAVLDARPGRALSTLYREFCATLGARYLTLPDHRDLSEAALARWLDLGPLRPGLDPARAGAVISFGAPVLDDWRDPETAPDLRDAAAAPFLIQVEPNLSRTATRADLWLPIRPGTEAAVGLGLAHLLRDRAGPACRNLQRYGEAGARFARLADEHTPQVASRLTGLDRSLLAQAADRIADRIAHGAPALFVGGGHPGAGPLGPAEEFVVWGLNLLLNEPGEAAAFRLRPAPEALFDEPAAAPATALAELPDRSLDLLLVDGATPATAVPARLLRRKMSERGRIVGLTAFAAGLGAQCDELLPVAGPGEFSDDVPARALSPRATWAVAEAVTKAPAGAAHPADRLAAVAAAAGLPRSERFDQDAHAALLEARAARLIERGGRLFEARGGTTKAVSAFSTPGSLLKALRRGGCWIDQDAALLTPRPASRPDEILARELDRLEPGRQPAIRTDDRFPWTLVVEAATNVAVSAALPPVLTKLYRESNLLAGAGVARVNPDSARRAGLPDGAAVRLRTPRGETTLRTVHDGSVMPDVVVVAPGPTAADLGDPAGPPSEDILELCDAFAIPVWRVGRASLRRV